MRLKLKAKFFYAAPAAPVALAKDPDLLNRKPKIFKGIKVKV
jgi:hypothetical protein